MSAHADARRNPALAEGLHEPPALTYIVHGEPPACRRSTPISRVSSDRAGALTSRTTSRRGSERSRTRIRTRTRTRKRTRSTNTIRRHDTNRDRRDARIDASPRRPQPAVTPAPRLSGRTCSSASTKRRSCSSTPTGSTRCRCARRRWSGTCTRRRSPAATSSTTSATRTTSRCATCSRRSSRTRPDVDPATLAEIAALHEAVLDQHRPVQQPHGAQVRADVHARGVRRRGARGRDGRRAAAAREPARRSTSCSRGCSRCSSIRDVDPIVTSKTPRAGQGHPRRRARTTCTSA